MMTTTDRTPRHEARRARALVLAGVVVACVAVSAVAAGGAGAVGALVGALLVLTFFGVTFSVLPAITKPADGVTLVTALVVYSSKLVLLAAVAIVLGATGLLDSAIDGPALGVTMIVCTLTVTVLGVVASVRRRIPTYDLGDER